MSDHVGRLNTLRVLLVVSACAMPSLFLMRESLALFYALLLLTVANVCVAVFWSTVHA